MRDEASVEMPGRGGTGLGLIELGEVLWKKHLDGHVRVGGDPGG